MDAKNTAAPEKRIKEIDETDVMPGFFELLARIQANAGQPGVWKLEQELFSIACDYANRSWGKGYELGHKHGKDVSALTENLNRAIDNLAREKAKTEAIVSQAENNN